MWFDVMGWVHRLDNEGRRHGRWTMTKNETGNARSGEWEKRRDEVQVT